MRQSKGERIVPEIGERQIQMGWGRRVRGRRGDGETEGERERNPEKSESERGISLAVAKNEHRLMLKLQTTLPTNPPYTYMRYFAR